MIYLLKFGASFVLPPGIFFVALFLLAVYLWRRERRAAIGIFAITGVFYLLSTNLVADWLMKDLENVYDQPVNPQGDVIIMLGGGATPDTPNQGETGNLCSMPAARLLTATELQHKLNIPVLVSGGQVYEDSGKEALIAQRELIRLGVPREKILVETESLNTRQNAAYSSRIMQQQGLQQPILVTSAFHMERSVLNFQKEGYEVTPFPTDYQVSREQRFHYNKLSPSAAALDCSTMYFREKLRTFVTRYME